MTAFKILILITLTYSMLSSQIKYSIAKDLEKYYEIDVPKDTIIKDHVKSIKGVLYQRKHNTDKFKKDFTACEKRYDTLGNALYEKVSNFCVDGYCSQIYRHSYTKGQLTESKEYYSDGKFKRPIKYYYRASDTIIIRFPSKNRGQTLVYDKYKKLTRIDYIETILTDSVYKSYIERYTTYDYIYNNKGQITRVDEVTKETNGKTSGVVAFFDYDYLGRKTQENINIDFYTQGTLKYTYRYNSANSQLLDIILYYKGEMRYKESFVYSDNKLTEINYFDDENYNYKKVKFTYKYYKNK